MKRSNVHYWLYDFPCFAYSTCRQSIQYPALLSARTKDLFASGRNCPNSESRSSCPRNRLATSVNTSSSDMPRKGRPLVFSCSFWKDTHRWSTESKGTSLCQKTHPEAETPMPQNLKGLWASLMLLQGLLSHTGSQNQLKVSRDRFGYNLFTPCKVPQFLHFLSFPVNIYGTAVG